MRGLELKLSLSIVLKTRLRSKRHCATAHGRFQHLVLKFEAGRRFRDPLNAADSRKTVVA